ncbi:phosphatidylinositol glycan [Heterostelium album PN500]|uniref:Phosphatidylinositol glycan n=1 Tax=Heterostelium pallidum (strain ATCC 26659 / Pp 5 / PN500) TaxID=670386 RepID=D3BRK8_HETP5|nr:phosphatidylinositol glycan [Heterostelium album PN500]EFA76040.1 phosphatidylinositol glycan [Heterostelium album PN500]|eukprot:XP_020428174.1 phosphatidylinositol glycan [Heterostelium album PN500]
MEEQYKLEHEEFVKNPTGSTLFETCTVLNIIPVSLLLQKVLFTTFFDNNVKIPLAVRVFLEFSIIVLPCIASVTYTEMTIPLILLMLLTCLIIPIFAKPSSKQFYLSENKDMLNLMNAPRKRFIEEYRAFVMIATIICILAVDFKVFPRRFSKTETFGISLMDIGVGSVVLSGAMVSRHARSSSSSSSSSVHHKKTDDNNNNKSRASTTTTTTSEQKLSRKALAYHAFVSNAPLMLLGFVRMLLTKSTNYQEHVTEYGIHWNFFFTLGFVSIVLSFLKMSPNRATLKEWRLYAAKLMAVGLFMFGVLYYAEQTIQPISRRMTNLTYVMAILALNIFNLSVNLLVSLISASHLHPSAITQAINRNQLFIFLLANIMTGLINFSIKTIYASEETSMKIIVGYTSLLVIIAIALDHLNITLKLSK